MTDASLTLPSAAVRRRRLWSIFTVPRLARADGDVPCFVCDTVDGRRRASHEIVFEDDANIAFLAKWPPLWGTALVCPKRHVEHVTADLTEPEFSATLQVVQRVGNALSRTVPCERLYVLSLGSATGNSHVHWHVAPLPPGTPTLVQQCRSYEELLVGRLDIPVADERRLGDALRRALTEQA